MRPIVCVALVLGLSASPGLRALSAQAVTTAAIHGVVTGPDSASLPEASVSLINTSNGERWSTTTKAAGRYTIDYLTPGGPYTIEVKAIGFEPARRDGIVLSLAERERLDFTLAAAVTTLPAIAVSAPADRWINPGRTGAAYSVTDSLAARLPIRHRHFYELIALSPVASPLPNGGIAIVGQPDRLNGLKIDGTTNNDLAGYAGGTGVETPAASSGVRTLAVEAIEELQIVAAPYDVRYGTFAGGLINAVTRSGSNQWHGTVTGYLEDENLTGKDSLGNRAEDHGTGEVTLAVGGPIAKDRASFFLNVGIQREVFHESSVTIGSDPTGGADSAGVGIRAESAERFQGILRDQYGVNPGTFTAEPTRNRSRNVFAKITLQPAVNQRIEVSHNYGHGEPYIPPFRLPYGSYPLSSSAILVPGTVNGTRATWTLAGASGLGNELTLARLGIRESCESAAEFPFVQVAADEGLLGAGQSGCEGSYSNATIWELTDNLSWSYGRHDATVGIHGEIADIDRLDRGGVGNWEFSSLDSLESGLPWRFTATIPNPLRPEGALASYQVDQVSAYAQDRWSLTPRLTLTAGIRLDVPFLPTGPAFNPTLQSELGVNTTDTPSGNPVWSPRLGFSYDLSGHGAGFLRGGIGLFAGRPAYHWFNAAYQQTGVEAVRIDCQDEVVPTFTLDLEDQPTSCAEGSSQAPVVTVFNPDFRFPRNLRASLGTDLRLPWAMVGSVDLIYIRGIDQFYQTDINLGSPHHSVGEDGRLFYGTIDPDNVTRPGANWRSAAFQRVIEIRNQSGDHSFVGSVLLQRRFGDGAEVAAAYTYTDTRDRFSPQADGSAGNVGTNPLDGPIDARLVATSLYSVPHKIGLVGALNLPWLARAAIFYNGYSGLPYTYTIFGDANADGYRFDDIVYVPRDPDDIALADPAQYAELDRLVKKESCLRDQRGRIMRRNSCREPWVTVVNARFSKVVPTQSGQSLELILDIFNLLNLLDSDWGVRREVPNQAGEVPLLRLVGYDPVKGRGIYEVMPVAHNTINVEATRWRMQLGARYLF